MSYRRPALVLSSLLAAVVAFTTVNVVAGHAAEIVATRKKHKSKSKPKPHDYSKDIKEVKSELDKANNAEKLLKKDMDALQDRGKAILDTSKGMKKDVDVQQEEVNKIHNDNKDVMDRAKEAHDKVDKVADQVEKDEPTDSPVSRARTALEKAVQLEKMYVNRVLDSAEYKTAYAQAEDTGDRVKMAEVRDQFMLNDSQASDAVRILREKRKDYAELRTALLEQSPRWKKANDHYLKVKAEADEAKKGENAARQKLTEVQRLYRAAMSQYAQAVRAYRNDQGALQQVAQTQTSLSSQLKDLESKQKSGKKSKKK